MSLLVDLVILNYLIHIGHLNSDVYVSFDAGA